ncbi:unnamed protein product [Calicophoron daubneyi]|uniref:Coiled-coil domain-containing protein n=1 Tax=Calicophoron daubneyi TaxID=300641 RepID=A0AAV2TM63_CALDB
MDSAIIKSFRSSLESLDDSSTAKLLTILSREGSYGSSGTSDILSECSLDSSSPCFCSLSTERSNVTNCNSGAFLRGHVGRGPRSEKSVERKCSQYKEASLVSDRRGEPPRCHARHLSLGSAQRRASGIKTEGQEVSKTTEISMDITVPPKGNISAEWELFSKNFNLTDATSSSRIPKSGSSNNIRTTRKYVTESLNRRKPLKTGFNKKHAARIELNSKGKMSEVTNSTSGTLNCAGDITNRGAKSDTTATSYGKQEESGEELSAWAKWLLEKEKIRRDQLKKEKEKKLAECEMKEKQIAERAERQARAAVKREEWLERKNRLLDEQRISRRAIRRENEIRERRIKEEQRNKAERKYAEWLRQKEREANEIDTERKQHKMDECAVRQSRIDASAAAFSHWLETAKHRNLPPKFSQGYADGKLIKYYDRTANPQPSFTNPVPWVNPSSPQDLRTGSSSPPSFQRANSSFESR